jgi:hypothetical protein
MKLRSGQHQICAYPELISDAMNSFGGKRGRGDELKSPVQHAALAIPVSERQAAIHTL